MVATSSQEPVLSLALAQGMLETAKRLSLSQRAGSLTGEIRTQSLLLPPFLSVATLFMLESNVSVSIAVQRN